MSEPLSTGSAPPPGTHDAVCLSVLMDRTEGMGVTAQPDRFDPWWRRRRYAGGTVGRDRAHTPAMTERGPQGEAGGVGERGVPGAVGQPGAAGGTGPAGERGRPGVDARVLNRRQTLMLFAFVALAFIVLIIIVNRVEQRVDRLQQQVCAQEDLTPRPDVCGGGR